MKPAKTPTYYVERPGKLDDTQRGVVVAGLQQAATTSSLVKNDPVLAGLIGQLVTAYGNIKPSADAVAKDRAQLAEDEQAYLGSQTEFDRLHNLVIDTVEHDAKSEADIVALNMKPRPPAKKPAGTPDTPPPAVPRLPKKGHGYAWATVPEIGKTKGKYRAEMSLDPIGPNTWAPLVGNGKQRKIVAASGTKVWVRFAKVHGAFQSDWSTPVLIVIP
jgi:hypothetical protein